MKKMMDILNRSVPYVYVDALLDRKPCVCGNPQCPAGDGSAKFYFFTRFTAKDIGRYIWWHGRN